MRRPPALLAIGAALVGLVVGCGDEPDYFGPSVVGSDLGYQRPTEDETEAGADIVRHVGVELYGPLAEAAGDANLAYSPSSIATVLGMARAGAGGDSATQLDELFGAEAPHRAIGAAEHHLVSFDSPVQLADGETMSTITVNSADAVWGQSGVAWEQPFLDLLRAGYDADLWNADFAGDAGAARRDINDWVASRTGERIDELLPEGSIDGDTRAVLTNATYFSAPWPAPLDELSDWRFTTATGEQHDLDMLGATGTFAHRSGDGWVAVTVPYAGGGLAMTFVLPDDLEAFEAELDDDLLAEATTGGDQRAVLLRLPPFGLATEAKLRPALAELGVTAPFVIGDDFTAMTTDDAAQPLGIDDIHHQAQVAVDETGTVAAAATAATFTTVGAPVVEEEVNLTRPFLFVIHDVRLGIPMFLGRVTDPTDTAS
jgi:serpin B